MANKTPNRTLLHEKFPKVYLHRQEQHDRKKDRFSQVAAELFQQGSSPRKFRLVPLNKNREIQTEEDDTSESRESYMRYLERWENIAIFCETKKAFLSCGSRTSKVRVEYRETVGASERFELLRCPQEIIHTANESTPSFCFRSHNGLYLNTSKFARRMIFQPESPKQAWTIAPILDDLSSNQRIKFVGVIDNSKQVVMKLQVEEDEDEDEEDTDSEIDEIPHQRPTQKSQYEESLRDHNFLRHAAHTVLGCVLEHGLKRGECTFFPVHNSSTRETDSHYYLRDQHGVVFMAVVSEGFSRALSGECINDLRAIYKKSMKSSARGYLHRRNCFIRRTKRRTSKVFWNKRRIQNELRHLVSNYNQHNESLRHHPLWRKTIGDRMEEAIDRVILDIQEQNSNDNIRSNSSRSSTHSHRQILYQQGVQQDIKEIRDDFRRTMRKLRQSRQVSIWMTVGAICGSIAGGAGGGTIGMAAGGVACVAFLAPVGAIAMGSLFGLGLGVRMVRSQKTWMWKDYVVHSSNYDIECPNNKAGRAA